MLSLVKNALFVIVTQLRPPCFDALVQFAEIEHDFLVFKSRRLRTTLLLAVFTGTALLMC